MGDRCRGQRKGRVSPSFQENTWRAGLDRLLLGYAMPRWGESIFQGIVPYDDLEGKDARILGRFLDFIETLFSEVKALGRARTLADWFDAFSCLLEKLFDSSEQEEAEDLRAILRSLEDLRSIGEKGEGGFPEAVDFAVIKSHLTGVLEGEAAVDIMKEGNADIRWTPVPASRELPERLKRIAINYFKSYLNLIETKSEYSKLFDLFDRFRILCALRQGPYGVEEINRLFEKILREAGLIRTSGPWYPGRPVMITRNDYGMRLFNGDVGLILPDPGQKGKWSACFRESDGGIRLIAPVRLPEHETVFALTVHKCQGSEFDELLLLLPDRDAPILTRELIYTAITRARKGIEIWSDEELFIRAVSRQIERSSGLRETLWGSKQTQGVA